MKVAFSTQDQQHVNAHFGWAKHIVVYDVTPDGSSLVETFDFDGELDEDGNEDKLAPKLAVIGDCAIMYCAAIGGSAAARVVAQKIHPIKVAQAEAIDAILIKLQDVLNGTPPPWLRKALLKGQQLAPDFEDEAAHV
jgi:nitrogen fixation protein NifX